MQARKQRFQRSLEIIEIIIPASWFPGGELIRPQHDSGKHRFFRTYSGRIGKINTSYLKKFEGFLPLAQIESRRLQQPGKQAGSHSIVFRTQRIFQCNHPFLLRSESGFEVFRDHALDKTVMNRFGKSGATENVPHLFNDVLLSGYPNGPYSRHRVNRIDLVKPINAGDFLNQVHFARKIGTEAGNFHLHIFRLVRNFHAQPGKQVPDLGRIKTCTQKLV